MEWSLSMNMFFSYICNGEPWVKNSTRRVVDACFFKTQQSGKAILLRVHPIIPYKLLY
jgi:hypothetical protein